jgi:hypothetical protein
VDDVNALDGGENHHPLELSADPCCDQSKLFALGHAEHSAHCPDHEDQIVDPDSDAEPEGRNGGSHCYSLSRMYC